MRSTSTRFAAPLGAISFAVTGCLGLDLSPRLGGVVTSVVAEGEALPEFAQASGGSFTMRVSGFIVGRLRCDTVEGEVKESGGDLDVTITVVTGRQGCNSLQPTTISYAANILNLDPGLTGVHVEYRYKGLDGPAGVRLDTLVTVGGS